MPKRVVILDPNGVEVANWTESTRHDISPDLAPWEDACEYACTDLAKALLRENPKLGTYTVTVKEVE